MSLYQMRRIERLVEHLQQAAKEGSPMNLPDWMPPLPEPATSVAYIGQPLLGYYSPDQMREYAAAAVEAYRKSLVPVARVATIAERDALLDIACQAISCVGSFDGGLQAHLQKKLDAATARDRNEDALRAELAACRDRLDWVADKFFERKWDGTIGRPSDWYVRGDYRHTAHKMKGDTFDAAIDAARKEQSK